MNIVHNCESFWGGDEGGESTRGFQYDLCRDISQFVDGRRGMFTVANPLKFVELYHRL